MGRITKGLLTAAALLAFPQAARAHVSVISGPAFAGTKQEITFGVGHGCSGADTQKVRVEIPAGVGSVRAEPSTLGKASVEKDAAGLVTAVSWEKPDADLLASDDDFYKLTLQLKVPSAAFTKLAFPAHQTCKASDGTVTTVDWIATQVGGTDEPAPTLTIVPAHLPGWNKLTVPVAIADLGAYFGDALIVWKGSAGYSANPDTAALIAGTPGVTALGALTAGDELWVKY